jgi:hypothetical protein
MVKEEEDDERGKRARRSKGNWIGRREEERTM